jgi:hypothetical protein
LRSAGSAVFSTLSLPVDLASRGRDLLYQAARLAASELFGFVPARGNQSHPNLDSWRNQKRAAMPPKAATSAGIRRNAQPPSTAINARIRRIQVAVDTRWPVELCADHQH